MYINEKTFNSHPETTKTQKEMDAYLFLEENGVDYIRAEHDEAATIELCEGVEKIIDAKICKNLLLTNRQQTVFYLLLIKGDMVFKTKYLSSQINSARLSFATAEHMETLLDVTPGSLTVLALMKDKEKKVNLLIEESVLKEEDFACHPMVNTATVKFKTDDLMKKILPALNREYTLVNLECKEDEQ
ncbi:MAG: prolyl-tRNA synthetase associated domain-containing protein [Clostridia bacterium]|nr:prolyl-tRNA synthetase associated domain-containing protein [Clostridia bacterium]